MGVVGTSVVAAMLGVLSLVGTPTAGVSVREGVPAAGRVVVVKVGVTVGVRHGPRFTSSPLARYAGTLSSPIQISFVPPGCWSQISTFLLLSAPGELPAVDDEVPVSLVVPVTLTPFVTTGVEDAERANASVPDVPEVGEGNAVTDAEGEGVGVLTSNGTPVAVALGAAIVKGVTVGVAGG